MKRLFGLYLLGSVIGVAIAKFIIEPIFERKKAEQELRNKQLETELDAVIQKEMAMQKARWEQMEELKKLERENEELLNEIPDEETKKKVMKELEKSLRGCDFSDEDIQKAMKEAEYWMNN